jgi:hypothetical protein
MAVAMVFVVAVMVPFLVTYLLYFRPTNDSNILANGIGSKNLVCLI